MSFYSDIAAEAVSLITEFGAVYTFTRYSRGAFDDDTGNYALTETTYTANVVKSTFSSFDKANLDIESTDIKLIAEPKDYEIGDTVSIGSKNYKIQEFIKVVEPATTKIIYILQVRI